MKTTVGIYKGMGVYLDSEKDRDAIALIRFQQDEIERLKAELTISGTMKRLTVSIASGYMPELAGMI